MQEILIKETGHRAHTMKKKNVIFIEKEKINLTCLKHGANFRNQSSQR